MASSPAPTRTTQLGETQRRDAWWLELLPVIILFGGFGIYATLRAIEGKFYEWGPYLSPFYSPLLSFSWWRFSPAILILGAPLGSAPLATTTQSLLSRFLSRSARLYCGRTGFRKNYRGETSFPFILQNVHRYFLYLAILFLCFLWYDVFKAFNFGGKFGVGLGTVIMLVNVCLLTLYTFSCHSLRHIVGGKLDCFSCSTFGPPRHSAWSFLTVLNERHMVWAWSSLISVGLHRFLHRMLKVGVFKDLRLL